MMRAAGADESFAGYWRPVTYVRAQPGRPPEGRFSQRSTEPQPRPAVAHLLLTERYPPYTLA